MIIEKLNTCEKCGNDWESYSMPHFTPRWCPSCKPAIFWEREQEAARRRNMPDVKPRKKKETKMEKTVRIEVADTSTPITGVTFPETAVQKQLDVVSGAMQVLTCESCGVDWERPAKRGRKPKVCPACKD